MRNFIKLSLLISLLVFIPACGKSTLSSNPSVDKGPEQNSVETKPNPPNEPKNGEDAGTTTPAPKPPVPTPEAPLVAPASLATARNGWGFTKNANHTTPVIPSKIQAWLKQYNGYYVGDTANKLVYLTFDEGYENGYTPAILDNLKQYNVKAAFFVTQPFITKNPALVRRMVEEGHMVVNHTITHRSMNELSEQELQAELKGVEDAFLFTTKKIMPKYVRPPQGDFSEKSLWITNRLGYKTIWWSIAYKDWDTANQPSPTDTMNLIKGNIHNGAIILLHAVSKTNSDKLPDIISFIKSSGYEFRLISDL